MKYLKSIVAKGKGSIAVILPDTVSSARWADFDAPAFKKRVRGCWSEDEPVLVQNALGSDADPVHDAQADIAKGAKVLILTRLTPRRVQLLRRTPWRAVSRSSTTTV